MTFTGKSVGTVQVTATYHGDSSNLPSFGTSILTVETPAEAVQSLINLKESMILPHGISTSLDAKLNAALNSINSGNNNASTNQLNAVINEVNAQTGVSITQTQAQQLISAAQIIISVLS